MPRICELAISKRILGQSFSIRFSWISIVLMRTKKCVFNNSRYIFGGKRAHILISRNRVHEWVTWNATVNTHTHTYKPPEYKETHNHTEWKPIHADSTGFSYNQFLRCARPLLRYIFLLYCTSERTIVYLNAVCECCVDVLVPCVASCCKHRAIAEQ